MLPTACAFFLRRVLTQASKDRNRRLCSL
jgi:hypothetical protein